MPSLFALAALLGHLSGLPCAAAEHTLMAANQVATTQTDVGSANVTEMLISWAKKAKGDPEAFYKILTEQVNAKPYPSVVGPSLWGTPGMRTYIKNGHHRASAFTRLLYDNYDDLPPIVRALVSSERQMQWRSDPKMMFKLDIHAKHGDMLSLIRDFVENKIGQLPSSVRHKPAFAQALRDLKKGNSAHLDVLVAGYRQMAATPNLLRNSPLRSTIGNAFFQIGFNSDHFEDYIEFLTGEWIQDSIKKKGLVIHANNATSPEVVEQVTALIFADPMVVRILEGHPRAGHEEMAAEVMRTVKERFREREAERLGAMPPLFRTSIEHCALSFARVVDGLRQVDW